MTTQHHGRTGAAGDPTYFRWQVPTKPVSVRLNVDMIDRLAAEATSVVRSITARGSEIGGVLLGRTDRFLPLEITISEYRLIPCGYSSGPLYKLDTIDAGRFEALIREQESARDGLQVVGYFRSNTRRGLSMEEDDLAFCRKYFAEPHQVALLLRPQRVTPSAGGIFVWEDGKMNAAASYLEFPCSRAELLPLCATEETGEEPTAEPVAQAATGTGTCEQDPSAAEQEQLHYEPYQEPEPESQQYTEPEPVRRQYERTTWQLRRYQEPAPQPQQPVDLQREQQRYQEPEPEPQQRAEPEQEQQRYEQAAWEPQRHQEPEPEPQEYAVPEQEQAHYEQAAWEPQRYEAPEQEEQLYEEPEQEPEQQQNEEPEQEPQRYEAAGTFRQPEPVAEAAEAEAPPETAAEDVREPEEQPRVMCIVSRRKVQPLTTAAAGTDATAKRMEEEESASLEDAPDPSKPARVGRCSVRIEVRRGRRATKPGAR